MISLKSINWSFLKSKLFLALVIIALIAYSAFQYRKIQNFKQEIFINNQNQIALIDSLKIEKQKNGEIQTSIASYIASEKNLKDINKDLYNRVHAQEGKVLSLSHAILQLSQDSAQLRRALKEKDKLIEALLQIDSNIFAANWTLPYHYDSTNYDIFKGRTYIKVICKDPLELMHFDTELLNRTTQIDLTFGQKVEDKQLRIFVQSSYPGFTVKSLEGVLIDPNTNPYIKKLMKKKHWFSGFGLGVGATGGFNVTSGGYGLVIGPSIMYNIYQW